MNTRGTRKGALPGFRWRPMLERSMRMLVEDDESRDGSVITNAMYAIAVFATNPMSKLVGRRRGALRRGARRVRVTGKRTAQWHRLLLEMLDVLQPLVDTLDDRRRRLASTTRRLFEARIPRAIARAIGVIAVVADYAFMFRTWSELWTVSFARLSGDLASGNLGSFLLDDMPPLLGSMAFATFMPLLMIALAIAAGKQLASLRDGLVHTAESAVQGERWRLGTVPLVYLCVEVALLLGGSVWFWSVGYGRIVGDASNAGLSVPAGSLAVMFALLPIAALVAETLSRSPLRDADEQEERTYVRGLQKASLIRGRIAAAELRSGQAWSRLAHLIARIVDEANLSIQLLEQMFAAALAANSAAGVQAPIRQAETEPGADDELRRLAAQFDRKAAGPALPRIEQVRGLTMPIPPWLLEELLLAMQVLVAYRPQDWTTPEDAARRLLELRRTEQEEPPAGHATEPSGI